MSNDKFENTEKSLGQINPTPSLAIDMDSYKDIFSGQRTKDSGLSITDDGRLSFGTSNLYGDSSSKSFSPNTAARDARPTIGRGDTDQFKAPQPGNGKDVFAVNTSDMTIPGLPPGLGTISDNVGNAPADLARRNVSDSRTQATAGEVQVNGVSSIVSTLEQQGTVVPDTTTGANQPSVRPESATQPQPEIWEKLANGDYMSMQQSDDPSLNGNIYSRNADGTTQVNEGVSFDPYAEYHTGTTPGSSQLYYRTTDGNLAPLNAQVSVDSSNDPGHPAGAWENLSYTVPSNMAFVAQEYTTGDGTASDLPKLLEKVMTANGQIISNREANAAGIIPGWDASGSNWGSGIPANPTPIDNPSTPPSNPGSNPFPWPSDNPSTPSSDPGSNPFPWPSDIPSTPSSNPGSNPFPWPSDIPSTPSSNPGSNPFPWPSDIPSTPSSNPSQNPTPSPSDIPSNPAPSPSTSGGGYSTAAFDAAFTAAVQKDGSDTSVQFWQDLERNLGVTNNPAAFDAAFTNAVQKNGSDSSVQFWQDLEKNLGVGNNPGNAPTDTPPAVTPAVNPPVDNPPSISPSINPPVDTTPSITPPVDTPPVYTPPVSTTPTDTPPATNPPATGSNGSLDMSSIFSAGDSGVSSADLQHAIAIANHLPTDMQQTLLNGGASITLDTGYAAGDSQGQNNGQQGQVYTDSGMADQALVHELYEMSGQLSQNTLAGTWNDPKAVALADQALRGSMPGGNPGDLNDNVGNANGDGDLMSNIFTADFFAKNPSLNQDVYGQGVLQSSVADAPQLASYIAEDQGLQTATA